MNKKCVYFFVTHWTLKKGEEYLYMKRVFSSIISFFLLFSVFFTYPVTQAEDAALTAQQAHDADQLAEVAGGDGVVFVLAVVGVVFIVLYLTGAIE